jgi:predicted Rossmann fold nucleotide-binding protein DprA/Smf involved in DNA uptake
MKYTDNQMCTILLSSYIGMKEQTDVKPLSLGEWHKFVDVLVKNNLEPSIVYGSKVSTLTEIGYDAIFVERLKKLADRGAGVAFELDEFEKKGIHVITYLEKEYPTMLRHVLKNKMPPVLFYAGDISLSNKMGIGVVGSRNISVNGLDFTEKLVRQAVDERLIIYSGGAKGVDTISQTVALNCGGAVTAYIADSLSARIKKAIQLKVFQTEKCF